MAMVCDMCGKGPVTGNTVSHSNRRTRRRWLPNLQSTSLLLDGKLKAVRICTRCLRTHRKATNA